MAKKKAEANRRAEAQEMNKEVGARIEGQDPVLMTVRYWTSRCGPGRLRGWRRGL